MCRTFINLLGAGPQNNARLKPVPSTNKIADSCFKPQGGEDHVAARLPRL